MAHLRTQKCKNSHWYSWALKRAIYATFPIETIASSLALQHRRWKKHAPPKHGQHHPHPHSTTIQEQNQKKVTSAYFSIHNARIIYTTKSKFVKNEHARYTFEKYEREIKCKVKALLNIYWTLKYSNKENSSSDSILLLATHVLSKNCLYFLTLVCVLSVHQKEWRKFWSVRYTLGARYRSKNTAICIMGTFIWVKIAHMVEKCAVLGRPAYLHHTRRDYYRLIVPYTRVHLECASDTFEGISVTPRLKHNQIK
jgi:hypothetical protein